MTIDALRQPWRIRDAVVALFAGVVGAVIGTAIVGIDDITTRELFGVVVPAQMIATILAVVILLPRRDPLPVRFELPDSMGLLVGAALQIGLSFVMIFLIDAVFGGDAPTQEIVEAAEDALGAGEVGLVLLGAVALAPLAEELVFRGVLLSALRRRWNDRVAYWGSAAGFALIHLLDPQAILTVPVLFVVGLVLARQALDTGRLGKPIATHVGFNLTSVLALLLAAGS
ncbi:MAG TPA: type II CAAX endopeptidase family protein [Acidimicrobiia bacterium]|nr:type II CAAX endopeptidase family protein [Acidimicrobiia bacterium]